MKNTKVVDADEIARVAGVSRRTIMRAANKHAAVVYMGNKGFVSRDSLGLVMGKKYDPSMTSTGAYEVDRPRTLQEVADTIKCSRSTVLRVIERTGLGVRIGGRRYVPSDQIEGVRKGVLAPGITRNHLDPKRMTNHARKMAAASARVRRKAAKVRRSGMASPSR